MFFRAWWMVSSAGIVRVRSTRKASPICRRMRSLTSAGPPSARLGFARAPPPAIHSGTTTTTGGPENFRRRAGNSVDLDLCGPDHFGPLHRLGPHERAELVRRAAEGFEAQGREALLDIGRIERARDFRIEPFDDVPR